MIIKKYGHYKSRLDDIRLQRFKDLPHFSTITPCSIQSEDFLNTLKPYDSLPKTKKDKVIINYKNVPIFEI